MLTDPIAWAREESVVPGMKAEGVPAETAQHPSRCRWEAGEGVGGSGEGIHQSRLHLARARTEDENHVLYSFLARLRR